MKHNHGMIFLLIGAAVMMFNFFGCDIPGYQHYSSKDTQLNITMDYPQGWSFAEERGVYGSYAQVVFLEPVKKGKPLRGMIVVTVKDESKFEIKPLTLTMFGEDLLKKRLVFKDAVKISENYLKFLGFDAKAVELSYSLPDNLKLVNVKYVPVLERIVFFKKGNQFYILRYVNESQDFRGKEKAFNHCVNTLKFKGAE